MAYSNQFLPFGTATGSNVLSNTSYLALAARLTGFQSGVALSQQVNKPLRQGTAMASMLGDFIAAYGGDALDDSDLTTLRANFEAALAAVIAANLPSTVDLSGYLLKSGGTMTGQLLAPAGLSTKATLVTSNTTLTTANSGQFFEVTSSSTRTITLPTPQSNGGVYYKIWTNSVANHTLSTPTAGTFHGPGASGLTTMTMLAGNIYEVMSDGYNWVLTQSAPPSSVVSQVTSSSSVSVSNNVKTAMPLTSYSDSSINVSGTSATIQTSGTYLITATMNYYLTVSGTSDINRAVYIYINGAEDSSQLDETFMYASSTGGFLTTTSLVRLDEGDTISFVGKVYASQDWVSGSLISVKSSIVRLSN